MKTTIIIIVIALCVVGAEIILSKKDNKWPGLILPVLSLIYSIMAVLKLTFYTLEASFAEQSFKTILNTVQIPKIATAITSFYIFIIYNILTVILFCIYYVCRDKLKRSREIEKMSIQDL